MFKKRVPGFGCLLSALLLLSVGCRAAAAGDLSLSGYYKSYLLTYQPAEIQNSGNDSLNTSLLESWTHRLRLNLKYTPQRWMDIQAAYDLAPRIQSAALFGNSLQFGQIDPFRYRAADIRAQIYPSETESSYRFALAQNLDRAMVVFRTAPADIIIGRQAIAWGSARGVNPTDVLAPFSFDALDTEDRIGIDAIRTRIPLGALSEIDAGYILGKDFEFKNSAFYGRVKFNVKKTDAALLFMGFRENLLAGLDLAGAIHGGGYWIETAFVFVDAMKRRDEESDGNYFRASSGIDYSFSGKTYGFIEYHFNGAGVSRPEDYLLNYSRSAYADGAVYLLGRHYLIPGINYQLSPLVTFNGQALINITDPSVFVTPQIEYNLAPNAYLGAGAFIGIGRRPAAIAEGSLQELHSEFGGYPNIYFGFIRYYF